MCAICPPAIKLAGLLIQFNYACFLKKLCHFYDSVKSYADFVEVDWRNPYINRDKWRYDRVQRYHHELGRNFFGFNMILYQVLPPTFKFKTFSGRGPYSPTPCENRKVQSPCQIRFKVGVWESFLRISLRPLLDKKSLRPLISS